MTGTQNGEESGAVVGPARVGAAFALASLLLALADSLMIIGAGSSESIPGELWWFAPRLLIAAPLVIGALAVLACHLGRRLARVHRLGALLMDVFLTVPWFVCTYALFSGPSIAASPFRIPGVAVVSLACLAAVRVLRVAPLRMRNWLRTHRPLAPDAIHGVGFLGAAGFSALVAWVTLHTFRGLYPAFHVALTLTAIVGAGTMLTATSNETFGRTWRRLGPLWPGGAGFVLWFALVPFCFPAAAGREVLSARTPFASSMVGAMFRTDLAITNLIERDASEGERRPVLAPLDGLHFLPGAPKRDILLVTVDALRGDVLDPGSRFGPCATGLQRVATRASAFPHAYAPSNATIRSLPGLLTGQVGASARTPGRQFLPRVLSEHGYSTSAWVSSHDRPTDLDDLIRLRRVGFGFATYRAEYQPSKHILEWAERELD
ncbi:MAG: sulfatase-like hydrolase/transferase, partial [Myxococcales bacterium]|nr:sulfatase-like hydrolase/transferase [Myxococcales bacterium]